MSSKVFDDYHGESIKINGVCYKFFKETTSVANSSPDEVEGTFDSCLACVLESSSSESSESIGGESSSSSSLVLFDPSDLSSLILWLDGADSATLYVDAGVTNVTDDGDSIQEWHDKSGNGYDATQTTESDKPRYTTFSVNENSVVDFQAGNTDFLNLTKPTEWTSSMDLTNFMVVKFDDETTRQSAIGWYDSSGGDVGGFYLIQDTDLDPDKWRQVTYDSSAPGNVNLDFQDGSLDTNPHIFGSTFDSTTWTIHLDATQADTTTSAGSLDMSFTAGAKIGENSEISSIHINGRVCEIVQYDRALEPFEREMVEGYLAWKWLGASALPSTHPFRNVEPEGDVNYVYTASGIVVVSGLPVIQV
jgi:hypothetical protein